MVDTLNFMNEKTASTEPTKPSAKTLASHTRAASRRKAKSARQDTFNPVEAEPPVTEFNKQVRETPTLPALPSLSFRYLTHLPTLGLSALCNAGLIYLMTHVYPDQVAHVLWPQSYLPLLLLFFGASFFGLSYLFLHSRRGFHWSLALTVLFWLRLIHLLNWPTSLAVIMAFAITELILTASHQ
jgi:hypothetical protein